MMMAPMYVLFEASILVSRMLDRRARHVSRDSGPETPRQAMHAGS
jgi:hypothetical protein